MNDLLPPSATPQERALALSSARVSDVPCPIKRLWNPDTCPLNVLPWLAWALSVEIWDASWPEFKKRAVVKSAISTAKTKGTLQAVADALNAIGVAVNVQEWFARTPQGAPHTFKVQIVAQDASLAAQALMVSEINRTKPLRAHYEIEFGVASSLPIGVVSIFRPAVFIRLEGVASF